MLRRSRVWTSAKSVLEVGFGSGHFLRELAREFPEKVFTGIEVDPVHLDGARQLLAGQSNVALRMQDFYVETDRYDVVVARMFVQHQKDLVAFAQQSQRLCRGGGLVVIDPGDDVANTTPPIDGLAPFLSTLRRRQADLGYCSVGIDVVAHALTQTGFVVEFNQSLPMPIRSKREKELYFAVIELSSALSDKMYGLGLDLRQLHDSLARWRRTPKSRAHLGELFLSLSAV